MGAYSSAEDDDYGPATTCRRRPGHAIKRSKIITIPQETIRQLNRVKFHKVADHQQ